MASQRSSPTVRKWELAERLRGLRQGSGLTVDQVAHELLCSPAKVSRMETAARGVSARDVRDLCRLYGVSSDEEAFLMSLARQAKESAWWQSASEVHGTLSTLIGLESAASSIESFQLAAMPGLLQTPEWSRALLRQIRTRGTLTEDQIEELVQVRLRRQQMLSSDSAPHLHFVLDEAILRRPVVPPRRMAAQVDVLLERSAQSNVTVQVIPFSVGAHAGLDGRFVILHFADQAVRDAVYLEGNNGELFLDKDSDLQWYTSTFNELATIAALDEKDSRKFLAEVKDYWMERA